jgi:hypothetical protein
MGYFDRLARSVLRTERNRYTTKRNRLTEEKPGAPITELSMYRGRTMGRMA